MSTTQRAMAWIVGRDTGTSSKTIWSVMQMVEPDYAATPADAYDFGRCYRLLKLIPEWRDNLVLVARQYPEWAPLVREWDALTALYEAREYERMYRRMCELRDEGLVLAGWTLTSSGCGHGPRRGAFSVSREALERALSVETRAFDEAHYAARW